MLVGQALALLYLDPAAVERGGVVSQEEIVGQLSAVLGSDALIGLFSPGQRKKQDERIAQRNVRQRVAEAVRRLSNLGFVELSDAGAVRLRAALLRFAEPVRGLSAPAEALAKLVAQGEVALTPDGDGEQLEEELDEEREFLDAEGGNAEPATALASDELESSQLDYAADGGDRAFGDDASVETGDDPSGSGVVSRVDAADAEASVEPAACSGDIADAEYEPNAGEANKPAVTPVRRVPAANDELDWADILLPQRVDAEDGSS
jgi:chromosome partition protein MukE